MKDLTKGSITKTILSFAIPIFFSTLLQLCYSLADTRIVGSFLGENALAAVGATSVLFTLNINFWLGTANGFGVYIARYFGAKNMDGVRRSYAAALMLGMVTTLVIMCLELIFIDPILGFLNVPDNLIPLAKNYIVIIIVGSLFLTLYDICTAALRSVGDSVTPLIILCISVILNIVGDVTFLMIFHTGVWGAAVATILSQFLAAIICCIYMMKRYEIFHIKKSDFLKPDPDLLKNMYALGLSMAFMNSMVNFGSLTLQTAINKLGNEIIVAHTGARKATEFFMAIWGVLGQAMTTYCSQNFGAGNLERIRKGLQSVLLITFAWCVVVLVMSYTISPWIIYMITGSKNVTVITAASNYLKFDTLFYCVPAVICITRNSLQGMDEKVIPLVSSSLEMVGKMIIAVTLVPMFGYWGVIVTEPIVWIIMVVPLVVRIRKVLRKDSTRQS